MELIKKIKQAEAEAQEIVEKAKSRAVEIAEESRKARAAAQADGRAGSSSGRLMRRVAEAKKQGQAEAADLKAQAETERGKLRQDTESKIDAAVETVVNYLKGLSMAIVKMAKVLVVSHRSEASGTAGGHAEGGHRRDSRCRTGRDHQADLRTTGSRPAARAIWKRRTAGWNAPSSFSANTTRKRQAFSAPLKRIEQSRLQRRGFGLRDAGVAR